MNGIQIAIGLGFGAVGVGCIGYGFYLALRSDKRAVRAISAASRLVEPGASETGRVVQAWPGETFCPECKRRYAAEHPDVEVVAAKGVVPLMCPLHSCGEAIVARSQRTYPAGVYPRPVASPKIEQALQRIGFKVMRADDVHANPNELN